jgi:hypothetical protein
MPIYIKDGIAYFTNPDQEPSLEPDQVKLIETREAAILAHRQAQAQLTPEQLIQAGEDAAKLLFG